MSDQMLSHKLFNSAYAIQQKGGIVSPRALEVIRRLSTQIDLIGEEGGGAVRYTTNSTKPNAFRFTHMTTTPYWNRAYEMLKGQYIIDSPTSLFLRACQNLSEIDGYGIDIDAIQGLAKFWLFFAKPMQLAQLNDLGVSRDVIAQLISLGFFTYRILAFDLIAQSWNPYFMVPQNGEMCLELFAKSGFEATPDFIQRFSINMGVYPTLRVDQPGILRWSNGMPIMPGGPSLKDLGASEAIRAFAEDTQVGGPILVYMLAIEQTGVIFEKIEKGWPGMEKSLVDHLG